MTEDEAWRHVHAANVLWTARSRRDWTLDLSMLTDAGVTLARLERAADRPAAAQRALHEEARRFAPTPTASPPRDAGEESGPVLPTQRSGARSSGWFGGLFGRPQRWYS